MDKFVVSTYYGSSEATYTFGPMTGLQTELFLKRLDNEKYQDVHVELLNEPELQGTGSERCLDYDAQYPLRR